MEMKEEQTLSQRVYGRDKYDLSIGELIELDKMIKRDFLTNKRYYSWLHENIKDKDTTKYKCVQLIMVWAYFEKKEYLFELDKSNTPDKDIDHCFKTFFEVSKNINVEEIRKFRDEAINTNNEDDKKIASFVLRYLYGQELTSFFISYSLNNKYCFCEKMVREYILYYINKKTHKNDEKIIGAIKKSNLYKLINHNSNAQDVRKPFGSQIALETNLLRENNYSEEISLENKFSLYEKLKITDGYIQYKTNFDRFCFSLLGWLCSNKYDEFKNLEIVITEYLNNYQSNTREFEENYKALCLIKQTRELLNLESEDLLTAIIDALSNKNSISDKNEEDAKKVIVEKYCIPLDEIIKENEQWGKNLVLGQYLFDLVINSDFDDYSGAIAYWCKCIEDMAYEKIYKELKIVAKEKVERCEKNKNSVFTLGSINWICTKDGKNFEEGIISCLHNKWKKNFKDIKEVEALISNLDELTQNYRNKATHRNVFKEEEAFECKKLMFDTAKLVKEIFEKCREQ